MTAHSPANASGTPTKPNAVDVHVKPPKNSEDAQGTPEDAQGEWVCIGAWEGPLKEFEEFVTPKPIAGMLHISDRELHAKDQRIAELERKVLELGGTLE